MFLSSTSSVAALASKMVIHCFVTVKTFNHVDAMGMHSKDFLYA